MSLYKFTTEQELPRLPEPAGLSVMECDHAALLAAMGNTRVPDIYERLANDHAAFIALVDDIPAAFGWMARGRARIGELNHEMLLPVDNRYLWNFRTMEGFRGLGIYPALLQYIIRAEMNAANTFWILHAPENQPSLRGIRKAGFSFVGSMYSRSGETRIEATSQARSNEMLLREMDILVTEETSPSCWK